MPATTDDIWLKKYSYEVIVNKSLESNDIISLIRTVVFHSNTPRLQSKNVDVTEDVVTYLFHYLNNLIFDLIPVNTNSNQHLIEFSDAVLSSSCIIPTIDSIDRYYPGVASNFKKYLDEDHKLCNFSDWLSNKVKELLSSSDTEFSIDKVNGNVFWKISIITDVPSSDPNIPVVHKKEIDLIKEFIDLYYSQFIQLIELKLCYGIDRTIIKDMITSIQFYLDRVRVVIDKDTDLTIIKDIEYKCVNMLMALDLIVIENIFSKPEPKDHPSNVPVCADIGIRQEYKEIDIAKNFFNENK